LSWTDAQPEPISANRVADLPCGSTVGFIKGWVAHVFEHIFSYNTTLLVNVITQNELNNGVYVHSLVNQPVIVIGRLEDESLKS